MPRGYAHRPDDFVLDPEHPLAHGLVFAGLGAHAGGTHYHDSSLYGNHGTLMDMDPASDWVSYNGRRGLDFDGSDDYVRTSCNGSQIGTQSWFMAYWLRHSGYSAFMSALSNGKYNTSGSICPYFYLNTTTLRVYGGATSQATVPDTTDTWAHYVIQRRAGVGAEVYVDGVACSVSDASNWASTNVSEDNLFVIGGRWDLGNNIQYALPGKITDMLIGVGRVLAPAEIRQLADPGNVLLSGLIQPVPRPTYFYFPRTGTKPLGGWLGGGSRVDTRPAQRPNSFELNPEHHLARGLVFAGLGAHAGGTHYHDSSLYGNHGVLETGAVWAARANVQTVDFSANVDAIVRLDTELVFSSSDPFSVALWTNISTINDDKCLWGSSSAGSARLELRFDFALRLLDQLGNDGDFTVGSGRTGTHHYVLTSDGATYHVYYDGTDCGDTESVLAEEIKVGAFGNSYIGLGQDDGWEGSEWDCLVYNRALSPAEIRQFADPGNVLLSGLIQPVPRTRYFFAGGGATTEAPTTLGASTASPTTAAPTTAAPTTAAPTTLPPAIAPTSHLYGPIVGPLGGPI